MRHCFYPALLGLLILNGYALGGSLQCTGSARDQTTTQLLYVETYRDQRDQNGRLRTSSVLYTDTQGKPLASKHLQYDSHPYAPEFDFFNQHTGYREQLQWQKDGQILMRSGRDPALQEIRLNVSEPIVADAGFNPFIIDHLDTLKEGHVVHFHFLNPARLTWFRFEARILHATAQQLEVEVAPVNRFLRWLVEPITLIYSTESRRLLQYQGLTNISLDGKSNLRAIIDYRYSDPSVSALLPPPESIKYTPHPPDI